MQRQGLRNDGRLVPHSGRIESRARARQLLWRLAQQRAGQRGRRGGVADTHLAADEQLGAGVSGARHGIPAGRECRVELRGGHGRRDREIGRHRRDAGVDQLRQRAGVGGRAQIDDFKMRTELARQHADRRAAADEIAQHLRRDRLRKGRYALRDHAVIAGKYTHLHALQRRPVMALQARELHGERFEAAERARRLGEPPLPSGGAGGGSRVRHGAGSVQPVEAHGRSPLSASGSPATVSSTRSQRAAMFWCSRPAASQ